MTVEATEKAPASNSPLIDLSLPFTRESVGKSRGRKVRVVHTLNRPSLAQLQARDASNPYRSQVKSDEEDRIIADVSGRADVKLYDALVIYTEGYKINVDPDKPENREAALDNIPSQHKIDMLRSMLEVRAEVVWDGAEDADEFAEFITWGDDIEYRARVEFGDQGQLVGYITLREPKQYQLDKFNAAASEMTLEKGKKKPVTKIAIKLLPAVELFDELLVSAEGFLVGGAEFDKNNPGHVALIDAYAKRAVLDAVVKETRLDLGNS